MHNYGVSSEVVRLALALGIIVSMLIYERWRATGGAVVVAGYLVLFVNRPIYLITTILISLATFAIVQYLIAPKVFLYGRRKLVVIVLIGMILQSIAGTIAWSVNSFGPLGQEIPWIVGLYAVGIVLPGLIAQDIQRQGVKVTILTLLGTTILTYAIMLGLEAAKNIMPTLFTSISVQNEAELLAFHTQLLIPAAFLSVIVSALLFEWKGIRSGGFLTAVYTALFVFQPLNLIFLVSVSLLVYLFVTQFIMRITPIFGRSKFALMVLTGLVFTWGFEILIANLTQGAFVPFAGFRVISPMITALIANDGERQGIGKTLIGATASTMIVFVAMMGLDLILIA